VAVVFAVGLTAPLLAADKSTSKTSLGSVDQTTMDIFAGLSEVATGEDQASPYLPPGQGGTPPGKPEGPANEERPPLFANNDKEKDKDKDENENENEDEDEDED
jgi:hypothetical protein